MQDQEQVIKLEGDVEGHAWRAYAPDDEEWLRQEIRRRGGRTATIKLAAPAEDDDTEGHAQPGTVVRVNAILDDDDTEGHAISLRFPTREEADAFRRRLLATGVLTGALVIGAVGVATVANQQSTGVADSGAAPAAITQVQDVDSDLGLIDQSAAGPAGDLADLQQRADRDIGIMDASGAGALDTGSSDAERAQAAESARLQAMADNEELLQSGQDWEQQRQQQTASGSVTDSMDAAYGAGGGSVSRVQTDASVLESGQDWEQQRQQQTASGPVTGSMDEAYGPGGGSVSRVQTDSSVLESGQDWEQQRQQQTPSGGSVTDSMDAAYGPGGGAVSAAPGSAALNALTGAGYSADEARAMIGAFAPDEANSPALNALTEAGYSPAEAEEMVRQAHLAQLGEGWESQREQQTPSNLESQNVPDWQRYAYGSESGTTGPVTGSMDEAYGPGGGAVSSASQAGPMDAIEGGAYSRTQSTSDAGPMDPLEAGVHPAYQSPAEAGPMDAIEGGAYSSGEGESSSDDETDRTGRFGPTPR